MILKGALGDTVKTFWTLDCKDGQTDRPSARSYLP